MRQLHRVSRYRRTLYRARVSPAVMRSMTLRPVNGATWFRRRIHASARSVCCRMPFCAGAPSAPAASSAEAVPTTPVRIKSTSRLPRNRAGQSTSRLGVGMGRLIPNWLRSARLMCGARQDICSGAALSGVEGPGGMMPLKAACPRLITASPSFSADRVGTTLSMRGFRAAAWH